jgi:hypothetical protein
VIKGKRAFGRPGYGWKDAIKGDLNRDVVWIRLSWLRIGPINRLVSTDVIEEKRPLVRPGHRWSIILKSVLEIWHELDSTGSV